MQRLSEMKKQNQKLSLKQEEQKQIFQQIQTVSNEDFDQEASQLITLVKQTQLNYNQQQNQSENQELIISNLLSQLTVDSQDNQSLLKQEEFEETTSKKFQFFKKMPYELTHLFLSNQFNQIYDSFTYAQKLDQNIINFTLTHLIFTYLDTKSFLTSPMICSEFLKIYRFKSTSKLFKQHCYYQWPSEVFSGSLNYLKTFKNWKDMLMKRPLIREDGLYICKMMYKRQGLSDRSAYNPVFEVTSYKYMRFQRDGTVLQIYTNQMPQKFLSQLMPILQGQTNVLSLGQDFGKASKYQEKVELSISRGTYHVWNDLITVDKHTFKIQTTEYREQYRIVRQNNLPVYAQKHLKSDYMELEWFGYKLEEDLNNIQNINRTCFNFHVDFLKNQTRNFSFQEFQVLVLINDDIQIEQQQLLGQDRLHQGYLPLKVNNHNPNQFKFKKMDELA